MNFNIKSSFLKVVFFIVIGSMLMMSAWMAYLAFAPDRVVFSAQTHEGSAKKLSKLDR
jgi:hypothetical protein